MVKGKDGSLKLCCPDCVKQGNNKPFRNFITLKNHLRFAGDLPGHKPRTLPEIYRLIFQSEVIHVDSRGRKKKQADQGQQVETSVLKLKQEVDI